MGPCWGFLKQAKSRPPSFDKEVSVPWNIALRVRVNSSNFVKLACCFCISYFPQHGRMYLALH